MTNCRWIALLVCSASIAPALLAEAHCPGNVDSVPLRHVNRYQMTVAVTVNGSGPFDFLLDTGTQITIIDPGLADRLHVDATGSARVSGIGSSESALVARQVTIAVGTQAVSEQSVLLADIGGMKFADMHIRGILGEDFLQQFDMLIDNWHGVLCLNEASRMRARLIGPPIPIADSTKAPDGVTPPKALILTARFADGKRPVRLLLDSGSNTPMLYGPSEYLRLGVISGASWHGIGVSGKTQQLVALPLEDVNLGGLALRAVQFLTLKEVRSDAQTAVIDGVLPTGILRRVFVSKGATFACLER